MSATFGCPAVLENDANAAALGEFLFGAGRGSRHMIYLTISTGIGGGLILDGQLYRGAGGAAGELGHAVIDEDGPRCGCGRRGCLEALASGTAIAARAIRQLLRGDPDDSISAGLGKALVTEFPWLRLLPGDDLHTFLSEFLDTMLAAAEIMRWEIVDQLMTEWKATAAIYADPQLAEALSTPITTGSPGASFPETGRISV